MRWLCMFSACRWLHYFNVQHKKDDYRYKLGIYQCTRCKTISVGAKR